ncbi:hypothetical protein MNBD_GAMMA22-918 [hydrothermal vent metagenome]|uniref:SlyX protein n=1 Tax=hydrothermal vent metagenome TaxID=652676 RepID=A0A3B1A505_9ZZZZ
MSQELIDIQIKMMHQQEELESMSNTVIRQGKQIEMMNNQLQALKTKFDDMLTGVGTTAVDEKPPHY